MSIIANMNLLCCNTLQDWAVVRSELPQLFRNSKNLAPQYRSMLIYFAMQNVAPFHVCTVLYREKILLLHGESELHTLLEFLFFNAPVERQQWQFPIRLPGKKSLATITDFSLEEKRRILSTRIPHCDFSIDSLKDLELLRKYYTSCVSPSICSPI